MFFLNGLFMIARVNKTIHSSEAVETSDLFLCTTKVILTQPGFQLLPSFCPVNSQELISSAHIRWSLVQDEGRIER